MRYSLVYIQKVSVTLVSLWLASSSPIGANTGSAITGDSAGGNPDSSTFLGDLFGPDFFGGSVTESGSPFAGGRQRPKNWMCTFPPKNEEGSLRYKTVATMLTTNLAGSDTLALISAREVQTLTGPNGEAIEQVNDQGPLFSCANRLAPLTTTGTPAALSTPPPVVSSNVPIVSGETSGAMALDGVQPAGQPMDSLTTASETTGGKTVSLLDYFNRPVDTTFFPVPAANKIQESLQSTLKLPTVPLADDFLAPPDTDPQVIKSKSLRDLVTTLQGLITEKTLLGDTQGEALLDVDQLAAAVKTYNELINLLDASELESWSKDRYGQDITATLKNLRSVCNCGWGELTTATANSVPPNP